jgi:small subunit ribosomal protein S9
MEKTTYFQGTGRRKSATAQVRLFAGNGAVVVNGVPLEQAFPVLEYQRTIMMPLATTENSGKYSVVVKVAGGGLAGQSDAIAHGISRALVKIDENLRAPLRQKGLLTRDPRTKERKKVGLKRARKAPQYTKR